MTGNDQIPRSPGGVVPLRTILRNFLNLVESCEAGSSDGNSTYEKEFQELKQFSENLKTDPSYLSKEGEKTVNKKKNRYKDILPFDYTRVILYDYGDVPGNDYINANFIKGASGSSAYIACQGPLPHTVNDFWRMVVECEVQVIVMACNEQESGKHKCENYWVEDEDVERQFGQVTIWLKKCRQVCPDFLVRTMRIRYTTAKGDIEERNVCQFHYSAWPDHGVPTKVRPLLDMVRLIRDCQTSETLPVLVHCSAGCGRTGTICAIDYVWGLLRLGKLSADFSLFQLVQEMRRQRIAMVQTKDQYILVHRAVKELFEEQLKIIDSHPYANVNKDGLPIDIKGDLEEPTYEIVEYNPSFYQPSTSVPPIPPPMIVVNSKSEKDFDDKHSSSRHVSQSGPSVSKLKPSKLDDITVLSSDCEEAEKEKPSPPDKKSIRNGLLRKPSIVKIKSFFEKSKDGKKSGGTNLSRAKSDVSSRFYSFNNLASSFHSHRGNQSQKSPTPSADVVASTEIPQKEKTSKPPLLAKPLLPVKRSKSLKLGKADSFDQCDSSSVGKSNYAADPPVTSTSSISNVTSNPIKVCIGQVDIPELKKPIVAKSVRPEIQTALTHELSRKPLIPPKNHLVRGQTFSHIKMGVAKEMEDVDISRSNVPYEKLKKYDTIVIKSPKNKQRTSLTRSQSHVWQPTKVQVPFRIFSDENIHQTVNSNEPLDERNKSINHSTISQSNGNISEKRTFGSFDEGYSTSKSGTEAQQTSFSNNNDFDDKPVVRRRVPKTNPYTNYTPGISAGSTTPTHSSPKTERSENKPAPSCSNTAYSSASSENKTTPKDLPQLKPGYTRSRENSSESSSNTATPRSSLPSTPTQTIDSTYAQIMRSNLHGLGVSKSFKQAGSAIAPTKSILKGSLSSTPSESDERLDATRQVSSSPSHSKPGVPSIITPPQKINTVRVAMRGIRERRNSFRQAVCKEDQPYANSNSETPSNPFTFSNGVHNNSHDIPSSANNVVVKSHKDYEPIWPEYGQHNGNFALASDDYVNRVPLKPQTQSQPTFSINNYSAENVASRTKQAPSYYGRNQSSQRSHSEERNNVLHSNANPNLQPGFQSRFDEIKLLLAELEAPEAVTQTQKRISSAPTTTRRDSDKGLSGSSMSSSSVGLKHQSSLRTLTRPQIQPGLSCFTFKKPTSLESLTDSFYYDVKNKNPVNNNGDTSGATSSFMNGHMDHGRNSNEYVSITTTSRVHSEPTPTGFTEMFPRMKVHDQNLEDNNRPIRPPRTKQRPQQQISSKNFPTNNSAAAATVGKSQLGRGGEASSSSSGVPLWSNADRGLGVERKNLPEVVRCSNNYQVFSAEREPIPNGQSNVSAAPPTSPKHIIKALGIFQTTAANMRSKWSEGRGKKSLEKSNTNGTIPLTTDTDADDIDGGFGSASSSSLYAKPPTRSKPRHQYL